MDSEEVAKNKKSFTGEYLRIELAVKPIIAKGTPLEN